MFQNFTNSQQLGSKELALKSKFSAAHQFKKVPRIGSVTLSSACWNDIKNWS